MLKMSGYVKTFKSNLNALPIYIDDIECEFFTVSLVFESKYSLQVYLDSCAYKIANKQMTNYLDDSLFETDQD